jgi:tRNA(Ile)-lysidine synthase
VAPGDRLLVAFSAGPDSTALLHALTELAPELRLRLQAAHLDHGLDAGSAARAGLARRSAARLGVPITVERRLATPAAGESPEAAARRVRYAFLDEVAAASGAGWIVTAHHRDDQAETVALRLLYGSGLQGLAGIRPRRGACIRPLLDCPRGRLRQGLAAAGLEAADDPTNADLRRPRNRLRARLLPALAAGDEGLAARLAAVAAAAQGAERAIARRLDEALRTAPLADGAAASWPAFAALPAELRPWALALLHRMAGARHPAPRGARRELERQLAAGAGVACDCGDGWRWRREGERLTLRRAAGPAAGFTYTLVVPGELAIPELGMRWRLRRAPVAPWMYDGSPWRAGLSLPLGEGERVTVRSRLPGDRLRPLGAPGRRRLKDVLIDHKVPRDRRDRLPLLCVGERIAWVPGVTVEDAFRLRGDGLAWVAEIDRG